MGVGDGGPVSRAVRGRPGIGARAGGTHRERAERVDLRDRATSRTDRQHVDLRQRDGHPGDLAPVPVPRRAIRDHRDIRAGPAHIEHDQIGLAETTPELRRRDRARGGPETRSATGRSFATAAGTTPPVEVMS